MEGFVYSLFPRENFLKGPPSDLWDQWMIICVPMTILGIDCSLSWTKYHDIKEPEIKLYVAVEDTPR